MKLGQIIKEELLHYLFEDEGGYEIQDIPESKGPIKQPSPTVASLQLMAEITKFANNPPANLPPQIIPNYPYWSIVYLNRRFRAEVNDPDAEELENPFPNYINFVQDYKKGINSVDKKKSYVLVPNPGFVYDNNTLYFDNKRYSSLASELEIMDQDKIKNFNLILYYNNRLKGQAFSLKPQIVQLMKLYLKHGNKNWEQDSEEGDLENEIDAGNYCADPRNEGSEIKVTLADNTKLYYVCKNKTAVAIPAWQEKEEEEQPKSEPSPSALASSPKPAEKKATPQPSKKPAAASASVGFKVGQRVAYKQNSSLGCFKIIKISGNKITIVGSQGSKVVDASAYVRC